MQQLQSVFWGGLRATFRNWRALLPLYIAGLLLGLAQTWPLLNAAGAGLRNPLLGRLAGGGGDVAIDLYLSNPATVGGQAGLWVLAALALTLLFSAAYNFFAGGIINAYLGGTDRSFWAACRRTFWSFTGLGLLLVVLAAVAIGAGLALGGAISQRGGLIAAFVLAQLLNMLGEYARALAVTRDRRNPFALLRDAFSFCLRYPAGTLALALLGLLLHGALALVYNLAAGAVGGTLVVVVLQQLAVLAWLWVKLLRLGWAAAYVGAVPAEVAGSSFWGASPPAPRLEEPSRFP